MPPPSSFSSFCLLLLTVCTLHQPSGPFYNSSQIIFIPQFRPLVAPLGSRHSTAPPESPSETFRSLPLARHVPHTGLGDALSSQPAGFASGPLHLLFPAWSVCSLSSPLGLQAHRLLSSAPLSTLGESFSEYPIKTYSTHSGQYFLSLSPLLSFYPWSSSPSENAIILLTRFTCFLSVPSNTRMEALGGEPFLFCPFGHCNPSPDSRIVLGTVRTQ